MMLLTLLSCSHKWPLEPLPRRDTKAWCETCEDFRIVVHTINEWYLACQNCKYARNFGAAEHQCFHVARLHAGRRNHTVHVKLLGTERVDVVRSLRQQLPAPGSAPPF